MAGTRLGGRIIYVRLQQQCAVALSIEFTLHYVQVVLRAEVC